MFNLQSLAAYTLLDNSLDCNLKFVSDIYDLAKYIVSKHNYKLLVSNIRLSKTICLFPHRILILNDDYSNKSLTLLNRFNRYYRIIIKDMENYSVSIIKLLYHNYFKHYMCIGIFILKVCNDDYATDLILIYSNLYININLIIEFVEDITIEHDWIILAYPLRNILDYLIDYLPKEAWTEFSKMGFIRMGKNKKIIYHNHYFNDEMVKKYYDKINWSELCNRGGLNYNILRNYNSRLDFQKLSNLPMSESFIIEFYDSLDINKIFINNIMSFKFLKNHIKPSHWKYYLEFNHVKISVMRKLLPNVVNQLSIKEISHLMYSLLKNQNYIEWNDCINFIHNTSEMRVIQINFKSYICPQSLIEEILPPMSQRIIYHSDLYQWINYYKLFVSVFSNNNMRILNESNINIVQSNNQTPLTNKYFLGNDYNVKNRLINIENKLNYYNMKLTNYLIINYKSNYFLVSNTNISYNKLKNINHFSYDQELLEITHKNIN